VVHLHLDDGRAQRCGELALFPRLDEAVLGRNQHCSGNPEFGCPWPGVVSAERLARLEHHSRLVSHGLCDDPAAVWPQRRRFVEEEVGALLQHQWLRPGAERDTHDRKQPPHQTLTKRCTPFECRGLHDEAGDEVWVATSEQQGDRPAHRVAQRDHRVEAQLAHHSRRIVGDVFEFERLNGSHATPVPAVIDPDERTHLGQCFVRREELQVRRSGPAVEQQHRRRRRIWMHMATDEELTPPVDANDLGVREPRWRRVDARLRCVRWR